MNEIEQLEQAIAALEKQREILGDAIVDTALGPMREKLATLQPPPFPEQRKQVTVLFADLVGFTAMSEKMDPEDMRDILQGYFTRWATVIEAQGGLIEKFIGDAVMAVFGMPTARENDPELALRAALAMRRELETLNADLRQRQGRELAFRIGIHTGPAVVSFLPERKGQDFVLIGDTVNLASRLQTEAPVNGILISHDTYRHVRGLFSVQILEPIHVKGKRDPIQVYLVQSSKPRAFRLGSRGVEGVETRLIGRESELRTLQDTLHTIQEDSERRMITLLGEAGIGKSRLLDEFDAWAELLPEIVFYFKGRASPAMQNMAYSLLRDFFAFRFHILDSDSTAVVRAKMERGFLDAFQHQDAGLLSPNASTQAEAVQQGVIQSAHIIGQLIGYRFNDQPDLAGLIENPRLLRERALQNLIDFFTIQTARSPVLVLLEDIHWADDASLDLIQELAAHIVHQPLLIVCSARPALLERRPFWGEGQLYHTRIELRPLSSRDSRRLVDEILKKVDQIPASLRETIINSAEGNPFFMEELVKMLIEDGIILKDEQNWRIDASRLNEVHIPPTLTGVLQARMDSLEPEERILLQRASVIGRTFWDGAVEFLQEQGSRENIPLADLMLSTPQVLGTLRAREMIYQNEKSSFDNTSEYLFKHALLRDVTYESVLKRDRRIYHLFAAQWLAEVTQHSQRTDEYASLIADHYERAGEDGQAAEWYWRAGRLAADKFANAEALRCLTRAIVLLPHLDLEKQFDRLLVRERVLSLQGSRLEQRQDLEEMGQLAERLGDAARLTEIALRWAQFFEAISDFPATIQYARQAVERAQAAGLKEKEALGYIEWGSGLWRQADYHGAVEPIEKGLELAHALGNQGLEAECLRNLAITAEAEGRYQQAQEYAEQSVLLKHTIGDQKGEAVALNSLAIILYTQGKYAQASQYFEKSLQIKYEIGDRRGEGSTLHNLGLLAFRMRQHDRARQYLLQAIQICEETGDMDGIASAMSNMGAISVYQGELERAGRELEKSRAIYLEVKDMEGGCETAIYLGLLHLYQANLQNALIYSQTALQEAQTLDTQQHLPYSYLSLGRSLKALGRLEEAGAALSESMGLYTQRGLSFYGLEPLAELCEVHLSLGLIERVKAEVDELLTRLEITNLEGIDDPAMIYAPLWRVLAALQDPRAEQLLDRSRQFLEEQAGQFPGLAAREQFLERVPSHRVLYASWKRTHDNLGVEFETDRR